MIPLTFPQVNRLLKKPEGWKEEECFDLPAFYELDEAHESGHWISCWKFTPDEFEKIKETGMIWLHISSINHPPVLLDLEYPFINLKDANS